MARSLTTQEARRAIGELQSALHAALAEIDAQRRNSQLSPEHQSYLNDYAMVRMAGYLEQVCFHAISGRVGEVATGHLRDFINSWFYKSPNLTSTQFRELFKRFGSVVDSRVKQFLDEGLNRDILNALLETRNAVAHGKESAVSGRQALSAYRNLVDDVTSLVDELLLSEAALI